MWPFSKKSPNSISPVKSKDPVVYDKAKYHFDSVEPDIKKAYTHTGMFLGWIIDHDLYSEMIKKESAHAIADFKERKGKVISLYEEWDGCLIDYMLNDEGNAFAQYYFDFEKGQFLNDYTNLFNVADPHTFDVPCTWENYEKLKKAIDQRYYDWKKHHR